MNKSPGQKIALSFQDKIRLLALSLGPFTDRNDIQKKRLRGRLALKQDLFFSFSVALYPTLGRRRWSFPI